MVPFPDTLVLAGETDVMSPLFVAVIRVWFALVIVTTENVFGLPFLGNDRVEGADNTHCGGVGDGEGDASADGDGEVPGEGLGSPSGSGDGSSPGAGDGSSSGEGDGDSSGDGLGLACGSAGSVGLEPGVPDTTVEGLELRVTSAIALS